MIRSLHYLVAAAAAILAECVLGNFHIAFPVSICVLWFIGRGLPPTALTAIGFAAGLFFDLLYFHPFPWNLWLFGAAMAAAWFADCNMQNAASGLRQLTAGVILGAVVVGGNLLLSSGRGPAVLFQVKTLVTILCAPLFLLMLWLLAGKEKKKTVVREREEKKPASRKVVRRTPRKSAAGKRSAV